MPHSASAASSLAARATRLRCPGAGTAGPAPRHPAPSDEGVAEQPTRGTVQVPVEQPGAEVHQAAPVGGRYPVVDGTTLIGNNATSAAGAVPGTLLATAAAHRQKRTS